MDVLVYLTVHLLKNIWLASSFWLLQIKMVEIFTCKFLCEQEFLFLCPRLAAAVLTLTGLCRDPRGGGSPLSPQTLRRNPLRVRGRWGPSAQSAGRSLASPRLDGIRWQRRPSSAALGSARCPPPIAHRRRRRGGGGGRRAGEGEGQSRKRRGPPAGLSSRGVFEHGHLPWAVWQSLDARVVSCLPSLYGRGN